MEIIPLEKGLGEAVLRASGALRQGGVIIYPTDTLYGLGADAFSDEAVDKVYEIKGRDERKPTHAVFADMEMVREYAELNDAAERLAKRFFPGPLTLILRKKPHVQSGIGRGIETIGVRIPDNEFCIELARSFGSPYTTTSANKNGMEPEPTIEKIRSQLGAEAGLVDCAIDAGVLPLSAPSTVVSVADGAPVVLREGAIRTDEILEAAA
jgi:L-threonylcarbamoyladenylate synthase